MRIGDLYNRHAGETIYVIGTGPSLRCVPLRFFKDKLTIGLNQAWRHLPTTYSITVHPELVPDYEASDKKTGTQWIIKKKPPMLHLELSDPKYYVFHTNYDVETIRKRPEDTLYLGEGIQTTAMDLAARLGAAMIVLVGCDAKRLGGDYHAHDQHVRWLGQTPDQQYLLYRQKTAEARAVLREKGIGVMTLSPFIGIDSGEEDYQRLRKELKLDPLPEPKDTSPYIRKPHKKPKPKIKPRKR